MARYILAGPARVGNCFAYFGHSLPEGRFLIVENGEYTNGGHGPCDCGLSMFRSQEEAETALAEYNVAVPCD